MNNEKFTVYRQPIQGKKILSFTLEGKVIPFARHKGMGKTASNPKPQRDYKKLISQCAVAYKRFGQGPYPIKDCPFHVECKVFIAPPASYKMDEYCLNEELISVIQKPDLDNFIKMALDGLNGIIWGDDCQVTCIDGSGKWYSPNPRLELNVFI